MKNFLVWLRWKGEQRTPTIVGVMIISVLLADLMLLLALGKKVLFPFSKTWEEYILWIGTIISFVTGYIFWPLSIAVVVLRAFFTRRKLGSLEVTSIFGPLFNRIAATLGKLAVSLAILGIECVSSFGLVYGLVWASRPPAPPRPGQLVISTHPGSQAYFRAISNVVAIYNEGQPGITAQSPIQYLQLPYVTPPPDAPPDWTGVGSIAVSFDESRIYATAPENGLVHFMDSRPRLHEIGTAYVGKTAKALALSADGKKLYVAVPDGPDPRGKIHVFDTDTLKEVTAIGNVGCPEDLFPASKRPLLFVASQCGLNNDPLYVIDTRKDQVIKTVPGFAVSSQVIATQDGGTVYVPTDDGLKIVRNYLSATPDIKVISQTGVSAMALTLDESALIVGTSVKYQAQTYGELVSFDARSGAPCDNKPFTMEKAPTVIAIAPDGELMTPMPRRMVVGDSRALECGGRRQRLR